MVTKKPLQVLFCCQVAANFKILFVTSSGNKKENLLFSPVLQQPIVLHAAGLPLSGCFESKTYHKYLQFIASIPP